MPLFLGLYPTKFSLLGHTILSYGVLDLMFNLKKMHSDKGRSCAYDIHDTTYDLLQMNYKHKLVKRISYVRLFINLPSS